MTRFHKIIAAMLACVILAGSTFLTAYAVDDSDPTQPGATESTTQPVTEATEETAAPEETEEAAAYTIVGTTAATEPVYTIVGTTAATEPEETQPETTAPAETEPPKTKCTVDVPNFYQTDYPDVRYGAGSVKTQGCGITSLAMVASYLTGHTYTPDVLAKYFGKFPGTNIEIMEHAAEKLQLPYYKATDMREAFQAVKDGCIVICMMNNQSVFTQSAHFIVLKQMTEDGRIFINDPKKPNYEKTILKDGFENGFPQGWISTGFAGAWIFDPDDMPAEPFIYTGERRVVEDIPLYFQTDYPDVRYGEGTIETSGCGIVSLAMVASYMTGHEYLPDELADYFGGYVGSNVQRMLHAADELKLPWHQATNWHYAKDALKKGALVIVLVDGRSAFTTSQHFLVVKGMSPEGQRVMVNDSYEPNYDKWDLKEGFEKGFTDKQITKGYCGAWIFDVNAMPEEPFIYEPEQEPYVEPRYGDYRLTAAEMDLLARMVWVESRGEPFEGQQAVAEVVLNRLAAGNFQTSLRDIVYAPNQFKSSKFLTDAEPTQTQYEAIEKALYGPYVLPIDVVFFAQYPVNEKVWGTIGGHTFCYQFDGAVE